nr:apolipoprotein N-acyltransferase [Oxalobacteraceae bacterium]
MLSLLSGAVTVFAFAPFGWWQIQIAALALLFILVQRAKSAKAAFRVGWAFATAAIAAGTHWLYISLHDYGGMPSWLASLAV